VCLALQPKPIYHSKLRLRPSTGIERRKRRSWPISRVLSWTVIHLGRLSPNASSNLPVSSAGRAMGYLFGLAPDGVYHAARVTTCAVRSYRTISPLPHSPEYPLVMIGGIFLLHFPSALAAQVLPGVLPCGARTFLRCILRRSRDCLANSCPDYGDSGAEINEKTAWRNPSVNRLLSDPQPEPSDTGSCAIRRSFSPPPAQPAQPAALRAGPATASGHQPNLLPAPRCPQ